MSANQFQTTVVIGIADGDDTEISIIADYTVEKGCLPSYYEPGASDTAFIDKIVDANSGEEITGLLFKVISTDQRLHDAIVAEWREARTTDAEYRAELRRSDRVAA